MSNHWHGVMTDPEGRLPEFFGRFHQLIARAQNASLGRWENLWSSEKTSAIPLLSDADVLDKMAYTLANPTAAGLVRSPLEWPGVISRRIGQCDDVEMPDVFFDDEGELEDEARLEFVRPAIFRELTDAELDVKIGEAVAHLVRRARSEMESRGVRFLGREAVLRQPLTDVPRTRAPKRRLNPRVAGKSITVRASAIRRLQEFTRAYRAAWLRWRADDRCVTFPAGTYALRIHSGVRCAQAP